MELIFHTMGKMPIICYFSYLALTQQTFHHRATISTWALIERLCQNPLYYVDLLERKTLEATHPTQE
jgi:hypothetical protein